MVSSNIETPIRTPSTISVIEILNYVKDLNNISSVVSSDVIDKLNIERNYDKNLTPALKYSVSDRTYLDAISQYGEDSKEVADT